MRTSQKLAVGDFCDDKRFRALHWEEKESSLQQAATNGQRSPGETGKRQGFEMKNRYFIFGLLIIAIAAGALGILWANHLPPFGQWRPHKTATLVTTAAAASDVSAAVDERSVAIGFRSVQPGTIESVDPANEMMVNENVLMVCAKSANAMASSIDENNDELLGTLSPDRTIFFCGGFYKGLCCLLSYTDSNEAIQVANKFRYEVEYKPKLRFIIQPNNYAIYRAR
jgi:hypothetical protein